MKTSSVNFNTPSPMESKHRRFVLLRRIFEPWQWKRRKKRDRFEQTSRTLERKISMRSTKELIKKDVLMPVKHNVFLWNLPDVEESLSVPSFFLYVSDSPLVSRKKEKRKTYRCGQRTVRLASCGMQPKPSSLRAQAHRLKTDAFPMGEGLRYLYCLQSNYGRETGFTKNFMWVRAHQKLMKGVNTGVPRRAPVLLDVRQRVASFKK
ncbi:phosphatase and actin regulator 2 [Trichonephila clavipes]|nr:phosphatase and actin regulator 2 [Trichonephila clavipes]